MTDQESRVPRELAKAIATNVRELRKLRGLTQAELASRLRMDQSVIAKIETTKRGVSAEELWALAAALEVEVGNLYDYQGLEEDGLLTTLVLTPERELESQLRALRRFVADRGEGTLGETIQKIEAGVDAYRTKVPDPYRTTASPSQVESALAEASRLTAGHQAFRQDILAALDRLDAPTGTAPTNPLRGQQRSMARRVGSRGDAK